MMPVRWVIPHLCGLPKVARDKRVLLMFRGFFDETNRNPEELIFVMAGWTATVQDWEKFSDAWQECFSQKPKIEYFKTYETNHQLGPLAAREKKLALVKVISEHKLRGYVAMVEHDVLRNRPKRLRKLMGTRIYD